MASVTVKVNGRSYPIICGDGEEDHLVYLSEYVDKKVRDLSNMAASATESQLLLMATLLIADDLSQAYETIDELKQKSTGEKEGSAQQVDLENWANRLEMVAERLEKA
ncbi:cell division protein ZapA [Sneathiella sp. P13V-1]|uniref:cell division protein ZapA n=1 Tax=Sneathiella sp. P13V-1 TaxID=2697366 RepID=UPI00187B3E44|nr:cell division protein ZapA [Sneathiella sp. P13V-1]MBE7637980.1 cell division protein ZapA [Sneathiella sp. P13V-1]